MAEEARAPSQAPGLSSQQEIGRLPNSSQSNSQDASQQRPSSAHPSTAPPAISPPPAMSPQNPDQSVYGPGLYAVSTHPQFMGLMPGFPPSTLIPLTFKIPTRPNSTGTGGEELGQEARQQQGPQRPLVRRFHFAIQLDLSLIIKLAAVVFLFSQEGSRQRFILLILFASFIYLYQTGALTPLTRWIRRGGAPPQLRPAIHPEHPPMRHADGILPQPDGNLQADHSDDQPPAAANEDPPEAGGRRNQNYFWNILKEIQMFVIGFITSLLPGFHHHNE